MILAKSNPDISLEKHINNCLCIKQELMNAIPSLHKVMEGFFNILELSVLFHDLGKCHNEFQYKLKGQRNNWNSRRHELFSFPFIESSNLDNRTKKYISIAVLSHHKTLSKIIENNNRNVFCNNLLKDVLDRNFTEEELFTSKQNLLNIKKFLSEKDISINDNILFKFPDSIKKYLTENNNEQFKNIFLIGALKHCDHLGSAEINKIEILKNEDFKFIDDLKNKLENEGKKLYPHQEESNTLNNVILNAPTGSGKTESALIWVRKNLSECGQGRIFYVLPYTASINAMYKRFCNNFSDEKVGMLHSKLNEFLYNNFIDENIIDRNIHINQVKDQFKKLIMPLKVTTPFQLLKNIFAIKGFDKGLTEMHGGYFIFDEIHSYDVELIAQILVLIKFINTKLNGKVFIMSATLPDYLKNEIKNNLRNVKEINAISETWEKFNRHSINLIEGKILNNIQVIIENCKKIDKVLIVCNTIKTAQILYEKLFENNLKPLLIHSKFNGYDRAAIEEKINTSNQNILIGTQVIEVSLDIDYDIIFTELSPLDSLIQRFGRVNRKNLKDCSKCFIFDTNEDSDFYIYNRNILNSTLKILKDIYQRGGKLYENKLTEYINIIYPELSLDLKPSFDLVYKTLNLMVEQLNPLKDNSNNENDFYKQFDSIKVLPVKFESEYLDKLNALDFVGAENFKVNVSHGYFMKFISQQYKAIQKNEIKVNNKNFSYFVIDNKYDSNIGLLDCVEDSSFNFL